MTINVVFSGAAEFSKALGYFGDRMTAAAKAGTHAVGLQVIRQAMKNSTGPPRDNTPKGRPYGADPGTGPGVVSGRHRRGIRMLKEGPSGIHGWMLEVGPTMVYSRRLELGFDGVDSAGRHWHQPPYPYLRPALDKVVHETALATYTAKWREAMR